MRPARPVVTILAALLASLLLAVPATATKPQPPKDLYGPDVPYCGSFKAGYRIWVWADGMSCRTAIAVQKKLWRGKPGKDWKSVNGGSGANGYIVLSYQN